MQSELVNTISALKAFLDGLGDITGQPPCFYVDLEGNNLSRKGTLSLMTIFVEHQSKVYLIDVTTLQRAAFDTVGSINPHRTLRGILESPEIGKVFFDIRNDSDALFSLFDVRVDGIEDLQLMELASRSFNKKCVNGLAKCIERDSRIGYAEQRKWQEVKDKGRELFDPVRGGTYAVFDQRPLSDEMRDYCVQDVTLMPHLREVYRAKLCDAWSPKIDTEVRARIQLSQSPTYNGKGRHMAEGPPAWIGWQPNVSERRKRTLFTIATPRSRVVVPAVSSTERAPNPSAKDRVEEVTSMVQVFRLGVGEDRIHDPQSAVIGMTAGETTITTGTASSVT